MAILTCPLHAKLYELECDRVAEKAEEVINNEMGKGHSYFPESKFHVLTRFRTKSINLHQLHYEFSTNCGLCQSNMSFMYKLEGPRYHWMKELLILMGLPIPDGLDEILEKENIRRMGILNKQKNEKAKAVRATRKKKRLEESKKWYVKII